MVGVLVAFMYYFAQYIQSQILLFDMVQKEGAVKRPRGRPRKFDEAEALEAAGNVFWKNGFSGTSLDDLAEGMGMNRPSIYRAFGDKEALYRRTLEQFISRMKAAMQTAFQAEVDAHEALESFFRGALAVYLSGPEPKGCLVMSTAVSAAVNHPEVQIDLLEAIDSIDTGIDQRLRLAIAAGELPTDFDTQARAAVAQSILHSLSLRARAGDSEGHLNRMIKTGVDLVLS